MAVREFDGVDDLITLTGSSLGAIANGPHSIVVIAKPLSELTAIDAFVGIQVDTSLLLASLSSGGFERLAYYTQTQDSRAVFTDITQTWQIFGVSKAAGTATPRFHRKELGAGSWEHINGNVTIDANSAEANRVDVGGLVGTTNIDARYAVLAIFATQLSDADFESIQTTPSLTHLADLGAVALVPLNQASVATAVTDVIGTLTQTGITGTTVVTGDDPPGFDFTPLPSGGPANTVAPAITGTLETDEVLTCSAGTWTGDPTITYAYQWKRNGSPISGATASTRTLVVADENQNISCAVTATNSVRSATAQSNVVVPRAPLTEDVFLAVAGSWVPRNRRVAGGGVWI